MIVIFNVIVCACHCENDDDDSADDDDTPLMDDDNDTSDDDSDDDSVDDDSDDDSSDDDTDDDTADDDDSLTRWCTSLTTAPQLEQWTWDAVLVAEYESKSSNHPVFSSVYGNTVWAMFTRHIDEQHYFYLGKYDDGEWSEWQVVGPEHVGQSICDVHVDNDGVWTIYVDPYNYRFAMDLSVVRWENGEIVEDIPVCDTGLLTSPHLYRHADGRFVLMYIDGGGQNTIMEQTEEGDFQRQTYEEYGSKNPVLGPDGLVHAMSQPFPFVIYYEGSGLTPFEYSVIGYGLPFSGSYTSPYMGMTSDGVLVTSPILSDERIWLQRYDGVNLDFSLWTPEKPERKLNSYPCGGVDAHDRPVVAIATFDSKPRVLCTMIHDESGIQAYVVDAPINKNGSWWCMDEMAFGIEVITFDILVTSNSENADYQYLVIGTR